MPNKNENVYKYIIVTNDTHTNIINAWHNRKGQQHNCQDLPYNMHEHWKSLICLQAQQPVYLGKLTIVGLQMEMSGYI